MTQTVKASGKARIYEYLDYREFLRDRYLERKKSNRRFSYRFIAGRIQLDPGTVSRILNGERHLDPEAAAGISKVFGLGPSEQDYFVVLIRYALATSEVEKNHFVEQIFRLRGSKVDTLQESQYTFYHEWYHSAMRALLHYYPFDGDFQKLGRMLQPPISAVQARKSVKLLTEIGMLEADGNGRYRVAEKFITSGEKIPAGFLNNLHLAMAELAVQAFPQLGARDRDFSGLTLSLTEKGLEEIKALLKRFRKQAMETAERDGQVNRVYRINLQVFPLTRSYGGFLPSEGEDGRGPAC